MTQGRIKMKVIKGMDDRRNNRIKEVRNWIAEQTWRGRATPDMAVLNKQFFHDVFVYGSLKQDFSCHRLLHSQAIALGTGWTMTPTMMMYENKKGGYPILMMAPRGGLNIYGQIYRIPTENLIELDLYEQNGILFKRQQRYVFMIDKVSREPKRVNAWVYIGVTDYWLHHMDKQDPKDPWIVPCNKYTRKEDPYYDYQIWTKTQDDSYREDKAF